MLYTTIRSRPMSFLYVRDGGGETCTSRAAAGAIVAVNLQPSTGVEIQSMRQRRRADGSACLLHRLIPAHPACATVQGAVQSA